MPPKYHPSNDTPRGENMPGYHSNNIYNIFNDEVSSLPDTIGSVDDTRAGEVSQLHDNDTSVEIVDIETVNHTISDIFSKKQFYSDTPEKQIFQYEVIIDQRSEMNFPFPAQSLRIDNYTNQWLFLPSLRLYIPHSYFSVILSTNGMRQLTIIFQAPPGITEDAPLPNTIVVITAHMERLIDNSGSRF